VLYLCGKAGSGKTEIALHICKKLNGRVQAGAGTGKAASNFNGPTVHGMFGWSFEGFRGDDAPKCNTRKLGELRTFYSDTNVFIIDEVNAMSAATLAHLHETMSLIFNPDKTKNGKNDKLPFGGKKVIFLGDPAQLRPVAGEPIYGEGSESGGQSKAARARGARGVRQSQLHSTAKGQELYRNCLVPNCIFLQRGQRNSGLLQQICDKIRSGTQSAEDLQKVTFQRRHFPKVVADYGIHYDNETCSRYNWEHVWSDCQATTPARRLYICKASYHVTADNQPVVDGLSALPPTKFGFAADVLCVTEGCDVRLIKNINVAAGLVNSACGTVVKVIYNNADVQSLIAGKNPPPYCIVVDFPGFQGFLTNKDTGKRVFPFAGKPQYVPVYRQKFVALRRDLPSWIIKKQDSSDCYRVQFPLDLSRHITTHRAQGQTLASCLVSVDLGLDNPERRLPADIDSIIYVAFTRVTQLHNLFVSPIFPSIWERIGQSTSALEHRKVEEKLIKAAGDFASRNSKHRLVKAELSWQPNYSGCDKEWQDMKKAKTQPSSAAQQSATVNLPVNSKDFAVKIDKREFQICLKAVSSERHIGIDQGRRNFAIVVVDKIMDEPPTLVAAENYDLGLNCHFKAVDVLIALKGKTDLFQWMQQKRSSKRAALPNIRTVDRVIVHVEQMSTKNAHWKEFGIELGGRLQRSVADVSSCVVKLSQPHIHRASGPMFRIGKDIVTELNLVPASYGRKRTRAKRGSSQPVTATTSSQASTSASTVAEDVTMTPVRQSSLTPGTSRCSKRRKTSVDSESHTVSDGSESDDSDDTGDSEYRTKKRMSARIFNYFVNADDVKQKDLGINVESDLQKYWQRKIAAKPGIKLDDVGDALLHALNEILCGGSNYKQLVPPSSSLHSNRTVIVAVRPDRTCWAVLHCTWNFFELEDFGEYDSCLEGLQYREDRTIRIVRSTFNEQLLAALTDMTGGALYKPVDHIKIVVKQLKGFQRTGFTGEKAGKLTEATVNAMKEICKESVGANSQECDRNDKILGRLYIQTNLTTGQKYQVLRSAGKQTNAMVSCLNWMMDNAKSFVDDRTNAMAEGDKLKFFIMLQQLACSADDRIEMIQLSRQAKRKLVLEGYSMSDNTKSFVADLILIGINKNEQHIKSVAANYRKPASHFPSTASNSASDQMNTGVLSADTGFQKQN